MRMITLVFLAVIAPIPLFHLVLHRWLPVWRRMPRTYYAVWAVLWVAGAAFTWRFADALTVRAFEPPVALTVVGTAVAGLALLLVPWSLATLGWDRFFMKAVLWPDRVPQRRITGGPFQYVRHPAYAAYRIAAIALFLATGFWGLAALAVWLFILTPFVIRFEEHELNTRTSIEASPIIGTLTCPYCGAKQQAEIPEGKCVPFYVCNACGKTAQAKAGDCCIFCSYGDRKCSMGHSV